MLPGLAPARVLRFEAGEPQLGLDAPSAAFTARLRARCRSRLILRAALIPFGSGISTPSLCATALAMPTSIPIAAVRLWQRYCGATRQAMLTHHLRPPGVAADRDRAQFVAAVAELSISPGNGRCRCRRKPPGRPLKRRRFPLNGSRR